MKINCPNCGNLITVQNLGRCWICPICRKFINLGRDKMLKYLLVLCLLITGCTMTAVKQGDTVALRGFGSGEAEFPDGTKIKKGLINLPPLKLEN